MDAKSPWAKDSLNYWVHRSHSFYLSLHIAPRSTPQWIPIRTVYSPTLQSHSPAININIKFYLPFCHRPTNSQMMKCIQVQKSLSILPIIYRSIEYIESFVFFFLLCSFGIFYFGKSHLAQPIIFSAKIGMWFTHSRKHYRGPYFILYNILSMWPLQQ